MIHNASLSAPLMLWFEQYTDVDWDAMQHEALSILAALEDEEEITCPDMLLAELIQQEEVFFWKQPEEVSSYSYFLTRIFRNPILLTAAAALVGATVGASRR
jgi:hypothetical protein